MMQCSVVVGHHCHQDVLLLFIHIRVWMDEPFELSVAVRYSLVQPFFFPILFSTAYAFVE